MPVCIVIIALFFMVLAVLLFLPCSYCLTADIKKPFRLNIHAEWLGHGFFYDWNYVFGQKGQKTIYTGWRRNSPSGGGERTAEGTAQPDELEKPAAETATVLSDKKAPIAETEPSADISDELLREAVSGEEPAAAEEKSFWWQPYVCSEDFLAEILHLALRLLHHSRIRTFTVTGTLGIGEPHQTGMLAGFLYMTVPAAVSALHFNFLEEEYNCRIEAAGRMYPGAVFLDLAACMLSRPVRQLIFAGRQRRKELVHG